MKMQYTVYAHPYIMHEQGGVVCDTAENCCADEYGTHDDVADAVDEALAIAAEAESLELCDTVDGFGSIAHKVVCVVATSENPDDEDWDGCGETVYEVDSLERHGKLAEAFKLAVDSKRDWLDYEGDGYVSFTDLIELSRDAEN